MSNSQKNYYIPVSDNTFAEIKVNAIEIWKEYDDTYGYATEKIQKVNSLGNIGDNALTIIAMFDHFNIIKLLSRLSDRAKKELSDDRLPEIYSNLLTKQDE